MHTLGLIGGTSWHSTVEYYSYINQAVNRFFGDNTNPPLLVNTVNQSLIHRFQRESNWDGIADILTKAIKSLEKAGAEKVMFCANTPHKVYKQVQQRVHSPIIHIADALASAIQQQKLKSVGFLGTKYSMTEPFISQRLEDNHIKVLTPQEPTVIDELHRIIQQELTYGKILAPSKAYVLRVIASMVKQGAEGVVLGCTEFPLMIHNSDLEIPVFNSTEIHARAAVEFILNDEKEKHKR